jgi:hypothetical protein
MSTVTRIAIQLNRIEMPAKNSTAAKNTVAKM